MALVHGDDVRIAALCAWRENDDAEDLAMRVDLEPVIDSLYPQVPTTARRCSQEWAVPVRITEPSLTVIPIRPAFPRLFLLILGERLECRS